VLWRIVRQKKRFLKIKRSQVLGVAGRRLRAASCPTSTTSERQALYFVVACVSATECRKSDGDLGILIVARTCWGGKMTRYERSEYIVAATRRSRAARAASAALLELYSRVSILRVALAGPRAPW
jgi:hypothetical protein